MRPGAGPPDGEKSLTRLFDIIDIVAASPRGLSGKEIAAAAGIPESTAFRMLKFLISRRMVCRRNGSYRLDFGAVRLGKAAERQHPLTGVARPFLEELAERTLETVHLASLRDGQVFYIDKVDGRRTVRMASLIGSTAPVYCTGVGKAMLAHLAPAERNAICAALKLKRFTSTTIGSAAELQDELELIRVRGYAVDNCEHEEGVYCVAAPILSAAGLAVAGISVSGSELYLRPHTAELAGLTVAAARELSARLGGGQEW